ncbi:hypothetical protein [Dysgonomonas alginatilytica]|uniref:hypothetical protein n=1 Tax=Dysgonomonas alginatilytica TaxID=1605892 RepID=UPI0011B68E06|nr:hypothetical protein [Dysgonomonas alginatilytica]
MKEVKTTKDKIVTTINRYTFIKILSRGIAKFLPFGEARRGYSQGFARFLPFGEVGRGAAKVIKRSATLYTQFQVTELCNSI